MQIFLATAFADKIDPANGEVIPEFKTFVTRILDLLRQEGHGVYCALEADKWRVSQEPVEIGVHRDLEQLDNADLMLAVMHDTPSAAVQFELGYAVAKQKRVVLLRQSDDPMASYNQGVVSNGLITSLSYDNVSMLLPQLTVAITGEAV